MPIGRHPAEHRVIKLTFKIGHVRLDSRFRSIARVYPKHPIKRGDLLSWWTVSKGFTQPWFRCFSTRGEVSYETTGWTCRDSPILFPGTDGKFDEVNIEGNLHFRRKSTARWERSPVGDISR